MQAKQGKEFVYFFTSAHTCSATSRKAGLIMCNGSSRGKKKAITTTSPFPPSSLQFLLLNTVPCGMGRSFGQSGSAVLFLLSQLLVPHSSLLARQHEELKCPWLCVKTALQHLKWCVISTVLIKKKNTKTQHHMSLCEEC